MNLKDIKTKPRVVKGKLPTGGLGYLNECHCPTCDELLFSYYDTDMSRGWSITKDWNYCYKCGQYLDFDNYPKTETN